MKRICKTADETDAFQHRHDIVFNHGAAKKVKVSYHRRERREGKLVVRQALTD